MVGGKASRSERSRDGSPLGLFAACLVQNKGKARLDAERGTSDQPGRPGRNAPAGFLVRGGLTGGRVCGVGRADPSVQHLPGEEGFTNADISLAVVAYDLPTLVALLVMGRLSNHLGRRPTSIASLGLLVLGCLLLLNVRDVGTLLAGRALLGLGAGLASSNVTAYIVDAALAKPAWRTPAARSSSDWCSPRTWPLVLRALPLGAGSRPRQPNASA